MAVQAGSENARPLVSVVIPAFNAAWSLGRTLASVTNQTWPEIEIIVVDDGSTDSTPDLVREHAANDPRIRLVRQPNGGVASARNRGLREARGEYFAPIDSDDLWAADNLEKQVEALEAAGERAAFAFAYSACIDEFGRPLPSSPRTEAPRIDFEGLLLRNAVSNGSAAVFRRRRVIEAGGYDERLRAAGAQGAEDWKLTLTLVSRYEAVLVAEPLVFYRINPEGMSHAFEAMCRSALTVIEDARGLKQGVPDQAFRDSRSLFLTWMLPRVLKARRWATALDLGWKAYGLNPAAARLPEVRALARRALKAIEPRAKSARPVVRTRPA